MITRAVVGVAAIVAISLASRYGSHHVSPVSSASAASITSSQDFHWAGAIPSGGSLRIRDLAGNIEVKRASGSTAEVTATQEPNSDRWWTGFTYSLEPVSFVTRTSGSDVIVCAISKSAPDCTPGRLDISHLDNWHPQPMHVVVLLPAGASIQSSTSHGDIVINGVTGATTAATGHGGISVTDASGKVDVASGHGDIHVSRVSSTVIAGTGHGDIDISADGAVRANTGHGDIIANLTGAAASGTGDMSFSSGHGSVTVHAPRDLAGVIDISTGHGSVSSSFPLTMNDEGRHSRSQSAHGTLGGANRSVKLSSGHGDVSLTQDD